MKATSDLFDLIKSLSTNEKRYIKLRGSLQSGGKNYLKLFGAIEQQASYDEGQIKKSFSKERFIRQLPVAKTYLYQFILQCLRTYHENKRIYSRLRAMLESTELLIEKKLYQQAKKLIKKGKETAEKYDQRILLLEFLTIERTLFSITAYKTMSYESLKTFFDEIDQQIDLISNYFKYLRINSTLFYLNQNPGKAPRKNIQAFFGESISNELMQDIKYAPTYGAKTLFYSIYDQYFSFINDEQSSTKALQKFISHIESTPHMINDEPHNYISLLNNYAVRVIKSQKQSEVESILKKMRQIKSNSAHLKAKVFTRSYNIELLHLINMKQFDKAVSICEEIEGQLDSAHINPLFKTVFEFHFLRAYFGIGEFKRSLDYCNTMLNSNEQKGFIAFISATKIHELIIHHELGNLMLLPSLYQSTTSFIKKQKVQNDIEIAILKGLNKFFLLEDRSLEKDLLLKFKNELTVLKGLEEYCLYYFDIIYWIDGKLCQVQ